MDNINPIEAIIDKHLKLRLEKLSEKEHKLRNLDHLVDNNEFQIIYKNFQKLYTEPYIEKLHNYKKTLLSHPKINDIVNQAVDFNSLNNLSEEFLDTSELNPENLKKNIYELLFKIISSNIKQKEKIYYAPIVDFIENHLDNILENTKTQLKTLESEWKEYSDIWNNDILPNLKQLMSTLSNDDCEDNVAEGNDIKSIMNCLKEKNIDIPLPITMDQHELDNLVEIVENKRNYKTSVDNYSNEITQTHHNIIPNDIVIGENNSKNSKKFEKQYRGFSISLSKKSIDDRKNFF